MLAAMFGKGIIGITNPSKHQFMQALSSAVQSIRSYSGLSVYDRMTDMSWTQPQSTRGQVDKAAKTLVSATHRSLEVIEAYAVINNWRSSHGYPLHIIKKTLQHRAQKIDPLAICAQRLKRLPSIANKLRFNRNMKLSQMQDIGGCRAILADIGDVDDLITVYEEATKTNPSGKRAFQIEKYDYIVCPKDSGYRSIHYVYKYQTTASHLALFNNLRIEIQIRTKRQHAWATAVETVSTFTDQALKSGIGIESWKRFFALMGSALALQEDRPLVPNTPQNINELIEELKKLSDELQVKTVLLGMSAAVDMVRAEQKDARAFLLVLNASEKTLQIQGFDKDELEKASTEYLLVEQKYADDPTVQSVLVSVDSIATLETAYPNYYLDTSEFLSIVNKVLEGHI